MVRTLEPGNQAAENRMKGEDRNLPRDRNSIQYAGRIRSNMFMANTGGISLACAGQMCLWRMSAVNGQTAMVSDRMAESRNICREGLKVVEGCRFQIHMDAAKDAARRNHDENKNRTE